MSKYLSLLLVAACFAGCGPAGESGAPAPSGAGTAKIAWETNYEAGLAKAKAQNKPVLLDFFATWCGPCKIMDHKTYTDASVAAELTNFVAVKLDVDVETKLAVRYEASSLPTLIILGTNGLPILMAEGYLPPDEMKNFLWKGRRKAR